MIDRAKKKLQVMLTKMLVLTAMLIPSNASAFVYFHNHPVPVEGTEFEQHAEAVGFFFVYDPATKKTKGFCTATQLAPRLILTNNHCFYNAETDVRLDKTYPMYFYSDRSSARAIPLKLLEFGNLSAQDQDWAFLELEWEQILQSYPVVAETDTEDWLELNGSVNLVGYHRIETTNGERDVAASKVKRTGENICRTDLLDLSGPAAIFRGQPIDLSFIGISDCPTTKGASGSPLFDTSGKIRAIHSFNEPRAAHYHKKTFGVYQFNAHILSNAFYEAYLRQMKKFATR